MSIHTFNHPNFNRNHVLEICESLKSYKQPLEDATPAAKEIDALIAQVFKNFQTNEDQLIYNMQSSVEFRKQLAQIGASLRRLRPQTFAEFNGTKIFTAWLAQARQIALKTPVVPNIEREPKATLELRESKVSSYSFEVFDPLLFESYRGKFLTAFNNPPTAVVDNAWTHVVADYMEAGASKNIRPYLIYIELLKKMNPPQTKLANMLAQGLTHLNYLQYSFLFNNTRLASSITNEIRTLKTGESMVLPTHIVRREEAHAMLMVITKQGPEHFSLSLFNSGAGNEHHHRQTDYALRPLFQSDFNVENIPETALISSHSTFIKDILAIRGAFYQRTSIQSGLEALYKRISALPGDKSPPNSNLRLWHRQQLGGSCGASCLRLFLRSQMPIYAYKQLKDISRFEFLLRACAQIMIKQSYLARTIGRQNDRAKLMNIALEVIAKIERRYRRYNRELPDELNEVRQKLLLLQTGTNAFAALIIKNVRPGSDPKDFADNIMEGFNILLRQNLDYRAVAEAMRYLTKTPPDENAIDNYRKVMNLVGKLGMLKHCSLNRDQHYVVAGLCSQIYSIAHKLKEKLTPEQQLAVSKDGKLSKAELQLDAANEYFHKAVKNLLASRPYDAKTPSGPEAKKLLNAFDDQLKAHQMFYFPSNFT